MSVMRHWRAYWSQTAPDTSTLTNEQAVACLNGDFVAEQGFRAAARALLRTRSGSELGRILAEEAVAHAQEKPNV